MRLFQAGRLLPELTGDVQFARAGCASQERLDYFGVFHRQRRAGGVQQDAADFQRRPKRVEQFALERGERGNVVSLTRELDIRVATDHARRRTRRIEQDALERFTVPPLACVTGIGSDQLGVQAQAIKVFPDAGQAFGLQIHRDHTCEQWLYFQQMAGFAARGAARVEYALAGDQLQQVGSQLRGFVLHADPAFGEARQGAHIARFVQHNTVLAEDAGVGFDPDVLQHLQVRIAAVVTAIDPQDHRRMGIVGRADRFPLLWPIRLQRFL